MPCNSTRLCVLLCLLTLHAGDAWAQRGPRGGGGGTGKGGGQMMGSGGGGGQGCMKGGPSSGSTMVGANSMGANMAFLMNNAAAGNSNRMNTSSLAQSTQQATPDQFVQAAMRFDNNSDGQLDRNELAMVATAVMSELRQRQTQARSGIHAGTANRLAATGSAHDLSPAQMVETFVTKSMTFDANADGSLNSAETKSMAAAFLRSLS